MRNINEYNINGEPFVLFSVQFIEYFKQCPIHNELSKKESFLLVHSFECDAIL